MYVFKILTYIFQLIFLMLFSLSHIHYFPPKIGTLSSFLSSSFSLVTTNCDNNLKFYECYYEIIIFKCINYLDSNIHFMKLLFSFSKIFFSEEGNVFSNVYSQFFFWVFMVINFISLCMYEKYVFWSFLLMLPYLKHVPLN